VRLNNTELGEVMAILGLVPQDFMVVKQAKDLNEAREVLKLVKEKARKGFKKAALRLHPDHNGGDEQKTALFIRTKAVLDHLDKLEVRPPPPPRPMPRMYVQVNFGSPFASTTSATSTTFGHWPNTSVWTVVT
jgi:hypothetical protein